MLDYEAVIRANQALDQVEKAVGKLAENDHYKRNATVYRVLGDVRMRQGKLQEALDTYRRALNML
jgi:predicted negative regulator of RcsB-dependent stress response